MALTPEEQGLTWTTFTDQLLIVLSALASSVVVIILMLRFLPGGKSTAGGGLVSTTSLSEDGQIREFGSDPAEVRGDLIGKRGTVMFALRPAGKVEIDGVIRDVVAVGTFLPAGTPIEVEEVEGNRIVVRQVSPDSAPPDSAPPKSGG